MKTIRFWEYINGAVKLSLRDGQELCHREGGPTDEGYSWTVRTWWLEEGFLVSASYTKACDCDGPIEHYSTVRAKLDELMAGQPGDGPIVYPVWKLVERGQRDHYAEAAGY